MSESTHPFLQAYRGYFKNMLRWEELEGLWQSLRQQPSDQWFIYAVGEHPPEAPSSHGHLRTFIDEIDQLLRSEHDETYCGIVYADDAQDPAFIKIYDPNNLGSVCGSGSAPPPFPGWILSKLAPVDLQVAMPPPGNRRRWWQKLFHSH